MLSLQKGWNIKHNMIDYVEDKTELETQVKRVALRLKEEREKARISQMDLSFMAGLSQNHVFCIETGKRTPNLYTILKLCNALHINPAVLFDPLDQDRRQARETVISLVSKYM
jgi:transcriptional regulator with XRE-family HTH domain